MAVSAPVDLLDVESKSFKEFNLDQDQVLDEIISNSPKSILNINCQDIPLDVDNEDFDYRCIPNLQHDDMLDILHFNTAKTLREQNSLNNSHLYQLGKHSWSSIFNQCIDILSVNGQKSPDFISDCEDKDLEGISEDWCVDFPIDDLVSGIDNSSAGTLGEESIFLGDTQDVLDDDSIIKIVGDLDANQNSKEFEGIQSSVQYLSSTNLKFCAPIYVPNNLHSKSKHISQTTEITALSKNETRSTKKKMQKESDKVDHVSRVGKRFLTRSKHRKVRNKPNNCYHLYDFIKDLLSGSVYADSPRCVEWVDEEAKEFRIVNTTYFARLWGEIKASKSSKPKRKLSTMTYEKVSRTLRYYCGEKLRILEKVEGKKCHFRFGTENTWSKHKL